MESIFRERERDYHDRVMERKAGGPVASEVTV
jgi:hypothetical protein